MTDPDYLVHENEEEGQKYKVALTHSSLSKVPTHQVHGGCTPEEVLVPFILLSNKESANMVKHEVKEYSEEIMLSNPAFSVTIVPQPSSVDLICNGRTYKMDRSGTRWTTVLQDISEGSHVIKVKPEGAGITELTIRVIGIVDNTDINDMFDL